MDLSKWHSVIMHMSARLGELSDWKTEAKARGSVRLMAGADELEPVHKNAIDREPNKACIEKLPSFRAAYEFGGMTPRPVRAFRFVQGD